MVKGKLVFTWGHLLWFMIGAIIVIIPYQTFIYVLTEKR
ncbi:hypothetical protein EDO6_02358 [Paenibacillus xylanexedens]|nr:hypothetical protein EDO6_02358 [Paenibacillus xylanexedens]